MIPSTRRKLKNLTRIVDPFVGIALVDINKISVHVVQRIVLQYVKEVEIIINREYMFFVSSPL